MALVISVAEGVECNGIIAKPIREKANGWGVVLIGGGQGNDLDWTVPGSLLINGTRTQMTISGGTHHDGRLLSDCLTQHGFQVLRWSTIVRGDPLEQEWPIRSSPLSQNQLIEQMAAAVRTLNAVGGISPEHTILVAHSQGVTRACHLIQRYLNQGEPMFAGLVAMSPAYFVSDEKHAKLLQRHGLTSCEEVLRHHRIPTLAIFGDEDVSNAVDSKGVLALAGSADFQHLEVSIWPGLGHQLGKQTDGRTGAISPLVQDAIATWCETLVEKSRNP